MVGGGLVCRQRYKDAGRDALKEGRGDWNGGNDSKYDKTSCSCMGTIDWMHSLEELEAFILSHI